VAVSNRPGLRARPVTTAYESGRVEPNSIRCALNERIRLSLASLLVMGLGTAWHRGCHAGYVDVHQSAHGSIPVGDVWELQCQQHAEDHEVRGAHVVPGPVRQRACGAPRLGWRRCSDPAAVYRRVGATPGRLTRDLLNDAVRLASRAADHDVPVELQVGPEVPHGFQGFVALLDDAERAQLAAAFIKRNWLA
jgi:hypothetical protein